MFRNNRIADNRYNFDVWGKTPSDFVNDVDTSNTVDGRPVYYWIGRRDIAVPLNAGCVILVNCTNITAQNLNLKNNGQGILLAYTTNSVIIQNNMSNNYNGIYLSQSSNNSIVGNIVKSNRWAGVYLFEASNDIIYHNNFINNAQQVYDDSWYTPLVSASTNVWDDGYPSGGNYWSDYEERYPDAEEIDDSGIWDTPYVIDEDNQDNYPLMELWSPPPSIAGDLNNDGIVDISDMATAGKAFGSYLGHPRWDSTADMNNDDVVNIFDLALIARNFGKTA